MSETIIEQGSYRFRVHHDWAKLPETISWGRTHAVVVDSAGLIHIAHTSGESSTCRDTVLTFDRKGRHLSSWGERHAGHAHGLSLVELEDGTEGLMLVDDSEGIFFYTLQGVLQNHIGKPAIFDQEEWKFGPANAVVAPGGDIYLVEGYGSHHVLHFSPKGDLLRVFGGWGEEDHHTNWAHGIFLDDSGETPLLLIATDEPSEIKRFSLDGEFHSRVTGEFRHPRNIFSNGSEWAIPEMQCRLTVLNRDLGETVHFGDWNKPIEEIFALHDMNPGNIPSGTFASPHGAAWLPDGSLIVTEYLLHGRVTLLERI